MGRRAGEKRDGQDYEHAEGLLSEAIDGLMHGCMDGLLCPSVWLGWTGLAGFCWLAGWLEMAAGLIVLLNEPSG